MLVHFGIKAAKVVGSKVSVCRPFVVDKKTTETYRRLAAYCYALLYLYTFALCRKYTTPVNQRRNSHKLRKMKKSVNSSAFVTTYYDDFIGAYCKDVAFAFALYFTKLCGKAFVVCKLLCK